MLVLMVLEGEPNNFKTKKINRGKVLRVYLEDTKQREVRGFLLITLSNHYRSTDM